MPRYVKGEDAIETSDPAEGVQLKAAGFKESTARSKVVRAADAEADAQEVAAPTLQPDKKTKTK